MRYHAKSTSSSWRDVWMPFLDRPIIRTTWSTTWQFYFNDERAPAEEMGWKRTVTRPDGVAVEARQSRGFATHIENLWTVQREEKNKWGENMCVRYSVDLPWAPWGPFLAHPPRFRHLEYLPPRAEIYNSYHQEAWKIDTQKCDESFSDISPSCPIYYLLKKKNCFGQLVRDMHTCVLRTLHLTNVIRPQWDLDPFYLFSISKIFRLLTKNCEFTEFTEILHYDRRTSSYDRIDIKTRHQNRS